VFVRKFEPSDAPACRELWAELTSWHRELYADPTIGGVDPGAGFDRYVAGVGSRRIYVAERDGFVIGFAGLIVRGDKVEIEPVVVTANERRHGVGGLLVESVVAAARKEGVRQVVVRPVARNSDALAFFHRVGFTALGHVELVLDFERHADYWRSGERLAEREFKV
jgi:N-acetylglutamate synthase-like GNAT family acetyltransferase